MWPHEISRIRGGRFCCLTTVSIPASVPSNASPIPVDDQGVWRVTNCFLPEHGAQSTCEWRPRSEPEGSNNPILGLTSPDRNRDPADGGAQLLLPPGQSRPRVPARPSHGLRRQGCRDPRSSPAAGRPAPPGRAPPVRLVRPGNRRGLRQARATGVLDGLPHHSRDDPSLAPDARPPALDAPRTGVRDDLPYRRRRSN